MFETGAMRREVRKCWSKSGGNTAFGCAGADRDGEAQRVSDNADRTGGGA